MLYVINKKQYNFKSLLEVSWALFFGNLGVPFDYEKQTFLVGGEDRFTPTFWLPHLQSWFMVAEREDLKDGDVYNPITRSCCPEAMLMREFINLQEWPIIFATGMSWSPNLWFFARDGHYRHPIYHEYEKCHWSMSHGMVTLKLTSECEHMKILFDRQNLKPFSYANKDDYEFQPIYAALKGLQESLQFSDRDM